MLSLCMLPTHLSGSLGAMYKLHKKFLSLLHNQDLFFTQFHQSSYPPNLLSWLRLSFWLLKRIFKFPK